MDPVVAQLLHPQRRVVQQPVDDRAGDRLDPLEVARRGRLPLARVLPDDLLGDLVRVSRSAASVGSTSSEPSQVAKLWISSSTIPSARRASP